MNINYIKYHNYRCFEDTEVRFDTSRERNISLVRGVVGSGKTEMLFSFQWVLYGLDFSRMREKENTPYSLNSALYHELNTNPHANAVDCWVELSFTHRGREYFVKRTETFHRNNNKNTVESFTTVQLSYINENGESSLPERDKEKVEELLSRIIPSSILEGIIFDGERMKKLNNADENTKKTIKGVIALVTNESLFDLCSEEIKHIKAEVSREKQKINRDNGNTSAADLEEEISDLEEAIEENGLQIEAIEVNLTKIGGQLEDISLRLSELDEANKKEQRRKELLKDLEREKKTFNSYVDTFYKSLADGYALITDRLVEDVQQSLDNIDVPAGLTVEAVKSILKRPKCICGCDMNDEIVSRLEQLMKTLPPDNISSTISYMAKQFGDEKARARKTLRQAYTNMHQSEDTISQIKLEISNISSSLIDNVSEKVRKLESERMNLLQSQGGLMQEQRRLESIIKRDNKRLKDAKKELNEASGNQEALRELGKRQELLDLFKNAIQMIEDRNRELSLASINEYLTEAFKKLSADIGRSIYLCQYEKKDKYRLVPYLKSRYSNVYTLWLNNGHIRTLEQEGLSKAEIEEKIILEVAEGNSTGQSKTNSLAFAKAILDYSNKDRSAKTIEVSHDYPFLIDSPFTELSGGNLMQTAQNIHSFANQIILMADDNSYKMVEKYVSPFVDSSSYLTKDLEKGISVITKS